MVQILFFPYINSKIPRKLLKKYEKIVKSSDIFIDYFPILNNDWSKKFKNKRLAYISIYKSPMINQLEYNTGLKNGSPTKEEVEINPYWKSISIDNSSHHPVEDEKRNPLIPFKNYKKGWYQLCLSNAKKNILKGIDDLMDFNLDGVFIDNVFPHNYCYSCNSKNENQEYIDNIIKNLKNQNKIVALNLGRKYLFNMNFNADCYIIENFIFGRKTDTNKLYFAGKYDTQENIDSHLKKIKSKIKFGKLVGYTKTPNIKNRRLLLDYSKKFAKKNNILWTSSLLELI